MIFDTHAHYDDKQFHSDRDTLLQSLKEEGISLVLNAACDRQSIKNILKLVDKYEFLYGSAGIHPHDAKNMDDSDLALIEEALRHPKIRALGEIGLDYHYDFSERDVQREWFDKQLALASKLKVPVIIHDREAHKDCLDILQNYRDIACVFHCYSGSWESAKVLLNRGIYLSFTGVITYKNAAKSREVIEKMPADRLMIETDCPYLSPEPNRGKRNDSRNLRYTLDTVSVLRGISAEEAAKVTLENGKMFFGIA